jgi:hypothetical protein
MWLLPYLHVCSFWHPRDEEQLGLLRIIGRSVSERVECIAALRISKRCYEIVVVFAGCTLLVDRGSAGARVDLEGDKKVLG